MCINGQVLIYSVRMPWWWPNGDNPYKHQNIANLQFSFDKVTEQNIENEKFQRFGANNFLWHKHCRDHRKICRNAGTPIMTWSRLAAMYTFKLSHQNALEREVLSWSWFFTTKLDSGGLLGDVEGVEDKDMVVVLGEGDYISFTGDLEATAARHLENENIVNDLRIWNISICGQWQIWCWKQNTLTWGHSNSASRLPSLANTATWNL